MKRLGAALVAVACVVFTAVPASAGDPAPAVTIAKDKAIYVSGQTEHLTVKVTGAGEGKDLVLTARFPNGTQKVVAATGAYDDTFHFSFGVYVNHVVRADVLDGDTVVATASVSVPQYARITTGPRGGYLGYAGSYAVFPKGAKPVFRSRDATGKVAKRCLRHEVQRRYASGWKKVFTSACRAESTNSIVDWKWLGKHPSKVRFRARGVFAGDAWNRAQASSWQYFKLR